MKSLIALFNVIDRGFWELITYASVMTAFALIILYGYPVASAFIVSILFFLVMLGGLYVVRYLLSASMGFYNWLASRM